MAKEMGVHPIAVAGAIADEYSTYDSFDEVQDTILAGLPDFVFIDYMHLSQSIKINPPVKWVLEVIKMYDAELGKKVSYIFDKLTDLTAHDFGKGNIKLETAMNLQLEYPEHFPGHMNCSEMAKYLTTDEGTVRVATIFMMDAKAKADFLKPFSEKDKDRVAFLITIYKQGIDNFKQRIKEKSPDKIKPGEGGTIIKKWEKFVKIVQ